jgi:hypothetical protein
MESYMNDKVGFSEFDQYRDVVVGCSSGYIIEK